MHCNEPLIRDVITDITQRDKTLREDDSIEILLDTNLDKKSFYHFAVNPNGVIYDASGNNSQWNSTARIVTLKQKDYWTVEIEIPLKDINADPKNFSEWGFQMVRNRPRMDEQKSYQWSPTFWYGNTLPSFFGRLTLQ